MKEVKLTNRNIVAIVDDADFPLVSRHKWHLQSRGYAQNSSGILMHRLIMGFPPSHIDHADHNGLHNSRSNLRIATINENHWNTLKHKSNTSGFKGVSLHKFSGKWESRIRYEGHKFQIGLFDDKLTAAEAYDDAAMLFFGEFATLNFPKVEKQKQ